MEPLTIRLLGSPQVTVGRRSLSFATRKTLALLVYLVVEGGRPSRDTLMALLWPESPAENAAATLRGTLARLRRALQPAGTYVLSEGGTVAFDFEQAHDLDLAWLNRVTHVETAPDELTPILALDHGEFLEGFSLPDAPEFDTWAAIRRETCQRQVETVYDRLTQHLLAAQDLAAAVAGAARWLARAPFDEMAYRRLMTAQALGGDRTAALQTYEQCQAMLKNEFGIEPQRETVILAENISRERGLEGRRDRREAGRPAPASPSAPGKPSLTLPLVGRAGEHSQMVQTFRQTSKEGSQVVALIGAAGVGKTRLVGAFQDWVVLDRPGVEVWRGRAYETGGRLPYQPVIEALRPRLEQENAPEDLLEDVWLAELSQLMPELRARYPDLPPPMTGDASFARSRLFAAVATLGSALAARGPAVFILDDMQWADADTRDLVHYLARRWAETRAPILLLLTVRQESFAADTALREWLAGLGRDVPLTRLLLDALNGTAVQELVTRLAGPDVDEEETKTFGAWLWAETRGLPFFIEALLQMLVEQGILTVTGDAGSIYDFASALHHVQSVTRVPMPPGVREVLVARMQQLSQEANALLLSAAVVGRECSFERLRQVADISEEAALATVETLLDARLLSERRAERRPYTLAHDYIRAVVYEESHEARRRVFHRRALLALEADRAPAAECAYHALASLLDEPAFRFSLAAGDEALASWAFEESLVHYDRAREVAQRMGRKAAATTPQSLQQLYQNRGRALELIEAYQAAQANYEEMVSLAAERHDQALELAALTAQCIIHARHNPVFNPSRAQKEGQAALALARTVDDRAAEARALWGMMLVGIYGGGSVREIMTFGQRSLALARELGLKEQMGYVLVNLCWPYMAQKQVGAALEANDEALAVWQALGNPPRLLEAYEMRQWLLFIPGDLRGMMAAARETLRLSRLTANQGFEGNALRFMAHVHVRQGRFAQALACAKEAMSLQRQRFYSEHANDDVLSLLYRYAGALKEAEQWADKLNEALQASSVPLFENMYLVTIAGAKIARGKLAEGQAILDGMLEGVQPDVLWSHMIIVKAVAYGYLQLARGRPERVFDLLLEDRVQDYRQAGFHYFLAEEHWLRGKAWLAMGEFDKARVALLEAREVAAAQEERTILWQILATLSEVQEARGDTPASANLREEARALVEDIAAHAGELREAFLSQPAVAQLLGET